MNAAYLYQNAPMYIQFCPLVICLRNLGSFSNLTFAIVNVDSDKFKSLLHAGVKTQQKKNPFNLNVQLLSFMIYFYYSIKSQF